MDAKERQENRELWELYIQEFKKSGLFQEEWCKRNGVPYSAFRYWKRKFEKEEVSASGPEWLKIETTEQERIAKVVTEDSPSPEASPANFPSSGSPESSPSFSPEPICPVSSSRRSCKIVCGAFILEFPEKIDKGALSAILLAVKESC